MTKKVLVPVMAKLARFENKILLFRCRYASMTTIIIARHVSRYIETLISSELLVLISFNIWGNPDIRKSMPGK